jgi:hypothetical protein
MPCTHAQKNKPFSERFVRMTAEGYLRMTAEVSVRMTAEGSVRWQSTGPLAEVAVKIDNYECVRLWLRPQ